MRRSSGRDGMEIGAHLRLSNGSSSNNSSSSSIGSGGGHGKEVNIAVLGSKGVGKSATTAFCEWNSDCSPREERVTIIRSHSFLAHVCKQTLIVRYLTRRFIGDYDPEMEAIFTHTATVDNKQILLHIMDTAWHTTAREPREDPLSWADGFLLVFSVTDSASWACVQELVTHLRSVREDERLPVAIAANKCDLIHLRRVANGDCASWAAEHGCVYREVSVSEEPESVEEVFQCLCRQVRTVHKKREKLSWIMQRPAVAAKLQIRQSLRNFAEKTWRSRTSTL